MTSITLYNQYGDYTISLNEDDLNMDDMFSELIKPLLLAAGYQPENIDEYLSQVD